MFMKKQRFLLLLFLILSVLLVCNVSYSQSKGLRKITEKELRYHLEFLGAKEFRGRETPSPELDIATLYLANWAKNAGLKPLMKDGSFYQNVPVTVTSVFQPGTKIKITGGRGEQLYYYSKDFGGYFSVSGSYSGNFVFAGTGICDPEKGWDDLKGLDLNGKVVMILDTRRPGDTPPSGRAYYNRLSSVVSVIRDRGASAVLSVIDPGREEKMHEGVNTFGRLPSGRMGMIFDSQRTKFAAENGAKGLNEVIRPSLPFERAEISQEMAAGILGLTSKDIADMFTLVSQGRQVPVIELPEVRVQLDVAVESEKAFSRNVIAVVEGSDPVLKDEYVVLCGHPDGLGIREGEVLSGADDNGTATVALMAIAEALLAERPKRSVILAWVTGEEKGMNGSHYFINNSPVPVEKISACLNMDMLGRNNTDSLFLVGSDLLSTQLDASIRRVNKTSGINFGFDYTYSSLTHPEQVYFRSDHYPFVRFGIPSVWFFSGFTTDYHTPRDITEFINYDKFYRITKLVYLTAFDIGNMRNLLKLDVNPAVTSRGSHNLKEKSLFMGNGK